MDGIMISEKWMEEFKSFPMVAKVSKPVFKLFTIFLEYIRGVFLFFHSQTSEIAFI